MECRSNKFIQYLGTVVCLLSLLITPVLAKKNPSEKRETAISRLIDMQAKKNISAFDRYLKKVIKLYGRHIKRLHSMTTEDDKESAILLAEAEGFHSLIQTGRLSHDATLDKLNREHDLMSVVERKLQPLLAIKPEEIHPQVVAISLDDGALLTGTTDHAPAKKSKRDSSEDFFDISISVPLDVGKHHGLDRLIEDE